MTSNHIHKSISSCSDQFLQTNFYFDFSLIQHYPREHIHRKGSMSYLPHQNLPMFCLNTSRLFTFALNHPFPHWVGLRYRGRLLLTLARGSIPTIQSSHILLGISDPIAWPWTSRESPFLTQRSILLRGWFPGEGTYCFELCVFPLQRRKSI